MHPSNSDDVSQTTPAWIGGSGPAKTAPTQDVVRFWGKRSGFRGAHAHGRRPKNNEVLVVRVGLETVCAPGGSGTIRKCMGTFCGQGLGGVSVGPFSIISTTPHRTRAEPRSFDLFPTLGDTRPTPTRHWASQPNEQDRTPTSLVYCRR